VTVATASALTTVKVRPAIGVALILTASTMFAVNGTVAKLVLQAGVDAPQLATMRATGAAIGLFAVGLALRPQAMRVTRRELPLLAVYGLTGFFCVPLLYLVAIRRLDVAVGLLLEFTAPIFVALWFRFVQRRPVRRRLWIGLALSIAGLGCVAEIWDRGLDPVGVAAGFTAAVLLAAYFLIGSRGVQRRDPLSLTAWAFVFGAIAGAVVRPWWSFPLDQLTQPRTTLLAGYVVVLGTTVPYLLLAAAMRHLPATSVSIVSMIEVVLAGAVAWIVLGEALPAIQLVGGGLILAGVVLAETARPPAETARPPAETARPPAEAGRRLIGTAQPPAPPPLG
jgi:drug/metabolite transporter (DMT)-like permease